MSNHSDLINKFFSAIISEPWDFNTDVGENSIKGKIMDIVEDDILLCKVSSFTHQDVIISNLAVVNRYVGSVNFLDSLLKKENTTANFMFSLDGHEFIEATVVEELKSNKGIGFLVGYLKID